MLLVEWTYGDRRHDDAAGRERFISVLTRTLDRGGIVVIPAFALDRTEVVLPELAALRREGVPDETPDRSPSSRTTAPHAAAPTGPVR
ncbi:hypothetical protein OG735_09120 [Streptomyces sp. NBC_01210]|uniref:hypothetical protein n=1 Tax=Streptomyces sp. NBC_01210 TaxID=2903774 RepID=UPI002E115C01|nr:hypothetical protein OG735_09120 [Streptomyces sp. NBC_01210]